MLQYKNHSEKLAKLKSKEISLVENVKSFLDKIESEKDINAYNFVFDDAVEKAEIIDRVKRA